MKITNVLFFGLMLALLASCSDDDDNVPTVGTLALAIDGLEDLGSDYVYEGWVIVDGNPVSTGTFTVDGDSDLSQTTFNVALSDLEAATDFVLTIEPADDPDAAPSATKYLAGSFSGNTATIGADIVGDFSNSTGSFFLRTPTDEAAGSGNNGNDMYGIWFGNPGMPPTASLELPTFASDNDGWAYEGWVVTPDGPVSTGTFTEVGTFDDSNMFSGTENNQGPPIPGEDFFNNAPTGITFPLDVRGLPVVISVEPVPDNSPAPFTLKPLAGMAGNDTAPATHDLMFSDVSFPTGTVVRP